MVFVTIMSNALFPENTPGMTSQNPLDQSTIQSESNGLRIESITESLSTHPEFDGHEEVVQCNDAKTGLRAIVAVHSTRRGPSLGGCRRWQYEDDKLAITDVLRLSKAMSYKHAIAGTPRGGGKAVILSDSRAAKTPNLLRSFGRFVDSLEGRYITAEDVGISCDDMLYVREQTEFVSGLPNNLGGSGDPSPMTAYGVFCGVLAALAWQNGLEQADPCNHEVFKDRTIAVQGLGHVGFDLCRQLHAAGAKLIVADVNMVPVEAACKELAAVSCSTDEIATAEADVYAPCALGNVLNADSIQKLRAKIVAGAANNQLGTPEDGTALHKRGILYAPDFVINAGGIINIANEQPSYNRERARNQTEKIAETLWQILTRSKQLDQPTSVVAEQLGRQRLAQS